MVASVLANIHRDRKKKKTEFRWYDFMPQWREEFKKRERKSPKELKQFFESVIVPHFNAVAEAAQKAGK